MAFYQLTISDDAENDDEARMKLGLIVDALSLDNDYYENNTSIKNLDTGEKVSIYNADYPEELKQNKNG